MEVHGYTEDGCINATIDGIHIIVPNVPSNRHRKMISEWEAQGNTIPAYEAPSTPLPTVVSMRRARLAMLQAGILDNVTAAVEQAGAAAQIEWEYAVEIRRDHPLIATLASGLGMSDNDIDALFEAAAAIE